MKRKQNSPISTALKVRVIKRAVVSRGIEIPNGFISILSQLWISNWALKFLLFYVTWRHKLVSKSRNSSVCSSSSIKLPYLRHCAWKSIRKLLSYRLPTLQWEHLLPPNNYRYYSFKFLLNVIVQYAEHEHWRHVSNRLLLFDNVWTWTVPIHHTTVLDKYDTTR